MLSSSFGSPGVSRTFVDSYSSEWKCKTGTGLEICSEQSLSIVSVRPPSKQPKALLWQGVVSCCSISCWHVCSSFLCLNESCGLVIEITVNQTVLDDHPRIRTSQFWSFPHVKPKIHHEGLYDANLRLHERAWLVTWFFDRPLITTRLKCIEECHVLIKFDIVKIQITVKQTILSQPNLTFTTNKETTTMTSFAARYYRDYSPLTVYGNLYPHETKHKKTMSKKCGSSNKVSDIALQYANLSVRPNLAAHRQEPHHK